MQSMTGYGKARHVCEQGTLQVEVKSVNHRYCEVVCRLPRGWAAWELPLKKQIQQRLARGRVELFLTWEGDTGTAGSPQVDKSLAHAYYQQFQDLATELGLGAPDLGLVVSQPEVLQLQSQQWDEADLEQGLYAALAAALDALMAMRQQEGANLKQELQGYRQQLQQQVETVSQMAEQEPQRYQQRLQERLQQLQPGQQCDPQRLAQEVALFADRVDINEEINRFYSHLQQLEYYLETTEPVGRSLDFLVQEMHREVNTMGSKSQNSAITKQVVAIKTTLEKVREQVQNVQ